MTEEHNVLNVLLKHKDQNLTLKKLLSLSLELPEVVAEKLCEHIGRHPSVKIEYLDLKKIAQEVGEFYK